jgi:hypothetical protein
VECIRSAVQQTSEAEIMRLLLIAETVVLCDKNSVVIIQTNFAQLYCEKLPQSVYERIYSACVLPYSKVWGGKIVVGDDDNFDLWPTDTGVTLYNFKKYLAKKGKRK